LNKLLRNNLKFFDLRKFYYKLYFIEVANCEVFVKRMGIGIGNSAKEKNKFAFFFE